MQLVISTLGLLPVLWIAANWYIPHFKFTMNHKVEIKSSNDIFLCVAFGLIGGLIIGYVTEIMTSYTYRPVQELS